MRSVRVAAQYRQRWPDSNDDRPMIHKTSAGPPAALGQGGGGGRAGHGGCSGASSARKSGSLKNTPREPFAQMFVCIFDVWGAGVCVLPDLGAGCLVIPNPMLREEQERVDLSGIEKAPTGITGLDEITYGGLPEGRPTLLCGAAGCGKTLFAMTFLYHGAVEFQEPGVFVAFEERPSDLITNVG